MGKRNKKLKVHPFNWFISVKKEKFAANQVDHYWLSFKSKKINEKSKKKG